MNIQVEVLDFEADATAEQMFLKRPPNFLGGKADSRPERGVSVKGVNVGSRRCKKKSNK